MHLSVILDETTFIKLQYTLQQADISVIMFRPVFH